MMVSALAISTTGEVEIGGRRYFTSERLAAKLGYNVRTLQRWNASRIGPPRIKLEE
jgi:hypothetical protein